MGQICTKRVFPVENKKKSKLHYWIIQVRISPGTKFQLKLTILIFWTKSPQERYFWSKPEKSEHHCWILHIWVGLGTKFQVKLTIFDLTILDRICAERLLPVDKRKSAHHHWILHIWISLSTKFQFKLTILIFWTKFAQKR